MARKFSEERTRKEMIDPQLEQAGWYIHDCPKVKIEIPALIPNIYENHYYADQIRFLRAVQSVFLQKRHLETPDLYDAPAIVGFGQDAVERWFTEKEVEEVVELANRMAIQ